MDEDGERSSIKSGDVSDDCEMITLEDSTQQSSKSLPDTQQSQSQSQQSPIGGEGAGNDETDGDAQQETNGGGEAAGSQPKRPKEVSVCVLFF